MAKITLYHFTSKYHLPGIEKEGLTRGDVPITPTGGYNAVWFTTNKIIAKNAWAGGSVVNKLEVRITVELDTTDPKLHKWTNIVKSEKVEPWWADALNISGGGSADNWYIYKGVIPPSMFKKIEQT